MRYTTRPLSDRTWLRPHTTRKTSPFDSPWTSTISLLDHEVTKLHGRDLVIEVDIREDDIRLDGMIRATARPASPAVVVAFDSVHGPMLYRADRYRSGTGVSAPLGWQANVRAVALTLQALRAVDRYGATETGQQYTGFKALPAGRAMPASHMTTDEAWSILGSFSDVPIVTARDRAAGDPAVVMHLHKQARRFAHPDRHGGDRNLWDQVEQAAAVLGVNL